MDWKAAHNAKFEDAEYRGRMGPEHGPTDAVRRLVEYFPENAEDRKTIRDARYRSSFAAENGPKAPVAEIVRTLAPGAAIFEYGVGLGANALWLAERGYRMEAQDVSDRMIARLREIMAERGIDFPIHDSAAQDHVLTRDYDAFVCTYLLHFMPRDDARRTLAAMRARTVVGGYHAVEIFTANSGDHVRPDRYYPTAEEFLAEYGGGWETVWSELRTKTGAQTGTTERLGALLRRTA